MAWSAALGLLGVAASGLAVARLRRQEDRWGPLAYWLLGLAALFPAWLVVFVALLGSASPLPGASRVWILSSAAALLGVIATDAATRRLHESDRARSPVTYWLLGVVAFVPAWAFALLGLR